MHRHSKRNSWWRVPVTVVLLLAFVPLGRAHQQWLLPNSFFETTDSAWVSFDHTFSDRRFHPGFSPGGHYQWWLVGPDGIRRSVAHLFLGKTRVAGDVELEMEGTYRLEGVEPSMAWTQIKVDGAEVWQPGSRRDFPTSDIVSSRTYFNQSIAYVSLKLASRGPLAASGAPLEILFLDHPNTLVAGKELRIKVLSDGRVLPQQAVEVFAEGGSAHDAVSSACTTDAEGSCKLSLPSAGRYLVVTNSAGDFEKPAETDSYAYSVAVMIEATDPTR